MQEDKKYVELGERTTNVKLENVLVKKGKSLKKEEKEEDDKKLKEANLISLKKEDAEACLVLQNSLSEKDRGTVKLREKEDYEKATEGENQLFGVFVPSKKENHLNEGKIVATSGLVETEFEGYISVGEKSPYSSLSKESEIKAFELSISIANEKYRGNGFQTKLYQQLLISEKTKQLKENYNLLFVAACELNNLASANSLLSAGLEVVNVVNAKVNGKDLKALVFAKKAEELELSKKDYTKTHIEKLKESKCLEKLDDKVLNDKETIEKILKEGKTILKVKENGKTVFYARKHQKNTQTL